MAGIKKLRLGRSRIQTYCIHSPSSVYSTDCYSFVGKSAISPGEVGVTHQVNANMLKVHPPLELHKAEES